MRVNLLLCSLLLLLTLSCFGQLKPSRQYTLRDGLPSNNIRALFKDSGNTLWIGTDAGLATYDGQNFTRFALPSEITERKVWAIEEDPRGNLWLGTYGNGLLKYNGKDFSHTTTPDITSNHIRVLSYSQRFNCLLVGTQNGFNCLFDDHTFSFIPDSVDHQRFLVMGFIETHDGIIFHTFHSGAFHFNPHTLQVRSLPSDSPLNVASSSASFVSSQGDTVIGLYKNGLRIVNNQGVRDFHDLGQVFDIQEDSDGVLWIATWSYYDMREPGGLYTWNGEELQYENPQWGIKGRMAWQVFIDPTTETIFLATSDEGLYKLINEGISRYPASFFGTDKLEIYDMAIYKNNLWFTTHDGVIYGKPETGFQKLSKRFFLQSPVYPDHQTDSDYSFPPTGRFLGIHIDAEQKLWLGTNNSLFVKDKDALSFQRFFVDPRVAEVFHVFPDGKVFSGSEGFRILPDIYSSSYSQYMSIKKYRNDPANITHMVKREDEIWFSSTFYGLYRYKDDEFTWYGEEDSGLPRNLNAICLDSLGNLVTGTQDGRVLILEGSDTLVVKHAFNQDNGITGDEILWLLNDSKNRLWIGTNRGINLVDLNKLYYYEESEIRFINKLEGLPEYNIRKAIEDEQGIIWLGGQENLIRIDPEKMLKRAEHPPEVELKDFRINYKEVNWEAMSEEIKDWRNIAASRVKLNHRQNNLTFCYATSDDLLNPEKVMYSYHLDGFGMDPSPMNHSKEITFTNLSPGSYTFQVKATNLFTGHTYTPLIQNFQISPPWWRTWYFYSTVVILTFLSVWLMYYYRGKHIRRIEGLKLEHERKMNSVRIKSVQAQMNPHFVFNVLSSIQSFMLDNDMDSTLDYLNEFSLLIRKTIENISKEMIPLSEEIDYLRSYVRLENLRLGNSVYTCFNIGKELKSGNYKIPPMIVQPFVENAFKHGLAAKKGKKILYLGFHIKNNALYINISDNGAGIKSTAHRPNHHPKGIRNTIERIIHYTQAYNKHNLSHFGVTGINRERKGKIRGLKVEIFLPLTS